MNRGRFRFKWIEGSIDRGVRASHRYHRNVSPAGRDPFRGRRGGDRRRGPGVELPHRMRGRSPVPGYRSGGCSRSDRSRPISRRTAASGSAPETVVREPRPGSGGRRLISRGPYISLAAGRPAPRSVERHPARPRHLRARGRRRHEGLAAAGARRRVPERSLSSQARAKQGVFPTADFFLTARCILYTAYEVTCPSSRCSVRKIPSCSPVVRGEVDGGRRRGRPPSIQ